MTKGLPTRDAVAYGVERTGRLVTAAALLFCVAIGAFATSHIFFVKQLGVGAALAVAIDATVVRALLVPALMGRLGERTWWAPAAAAQAACPHRAARAGPGTGRPHTHGNRAGRSLTDGRRTPATGSVPGDVDEDRTAGARLERG